MDVHPELPIYIDSTMISCFRSCPQKFYKEFILGLRPAALSIDLHAGACFASGLESFYEATHWHGKSFSEALAIAYKHYLAQWGDFIPMKDTPKTRDNVWLAIEDYLNHYPPKTDIVQPYRKADGTPTMEFTFAIPLEPCEEATIEHIDANTTYRNFDPAYYSTDTHHPFPVHPVTREPFLYSGRFDMLGEMNKRVVWRDEKTTTSISSNWSNQWNLRSQFSGYTWALQHEGFETDTGVIRGIGILKTKFHQVEAIKQYNKQNVARWHDQLRRDLWRLVRMWQEGYWDFNLAESCTAYGGCPFNDLCNSPNEANWYSQYVVRRWNPTQKNPIAEKVAA